MYYSLSKKIIEKIINPIIVFAVNVTVFKNESKEDRKSTKRRVL